MKKPFMVFRKQRNILAILLSAVILTAGAILIIESDGDDGDAVQVMAGQAESASNRTITDLLGRVLN